MNDAQTLLNQVKVLDAKISAKLEERQKLFDMATKITTSLRPDAGSYSGFGDKLGNAVAKIADLESEIDEAVDQLVDTKRNISRILDQIADADQYKILYKRYYEGKAWELIACELFMTYRNVCYIHGKALVEFERIMKK